MPILLKLHEQVYRYGELKEKIPHISHKTLVTQLKILQQNGLVNRQAYPVVPPKVEYSLTERGRAAIPVIENISKFGLYLMSEFEEEIKFLNRD